MQIKERKLDLIRQKIKDDEYQKNTDFVLTKTKQQATQAQLEEHIQKLYSDAERKEERRKKLESQITKTQCPFQPNLNNQNHIPPKPDSKSKTVTNRDLPQQNVDRGRSKPNKRGTKDIDMNWDNF